MPSSDAECRSFHRKFPARKFYTTKEIVSWDRKPNRNFLERFLGSSDFQQFFLIPSTFWFRIKLSFALFQKLWIYRGCLKSGMWESVQDICSLENPSKIVLTSNIHFKSERNKISRHSNPNHSGKFISLAEAKQASRGRRSWMLFFAYTKVHVMAFGTNVGRWKYRFDCYNILCLAPSGSSSWVNDGIKPMICLPNTKLRWN